MEKLINYKLNITMKKIFYILLALPILLVGCKDKKKEDKKSASVAYVPSITVAAPIVKNVTLTK